MEFERKQPVSSGCMTCERYGQTCDGADRPGECLAKITKEVNDDGREWPQD